MSLILGYANINAAIVMSDGRAGKPGSYNEYHNKTNKINDKIIVGSCGYAEECNFVLDTIINEAGDVLENYNLDDFFR
jgi:20S proteasome alpha/beta subunit